MQRNLFSGRVYFWSPLPVQKYRRKQQRRRHVRQPIVARAKYLMCLCRYLSVSIWRYNNKSPLFFTKMRRYHFLPSRGIEKGGPSKHFPFKSLWGVNFLTLHNFLSSSLSLSVTILSIVWSLSSDQWFDLFSYPSQIWVSRRRLIISIDCLT